MRISQLHPYQLVFFLLISISFLFTNSLLGQKQAFEKANRLYKNKCFAQAVPFYIEGLEEKKNVAAMAKLAICYRITNQMEKAEEVLVEVVKSERTKPINYFYLGETLMNNGKYEEAKKWLRHYIELEPMDEKAQLCLEACDLVKDIKPYFAEIEIESFAYNSEADDSSPVYFNDELLFCSDRKQGAKLLKQKAGWTDRDFLKIYSSTKQENSVYSNPVPFSSKINELNKNTANPTFWKDTITGQTEIYFVRNSFESSEKDEYNLQLFRAISDNDKTWRKLELVNFCNKEKNYMHPSISASGDTLFFVSPQGRKGQGGTDIYFSIRKKDNTWATPQNIGPIVNTTGNEGFPYIHSDGKLFFCSKGHAGFGGFDIFVTQQNKETGLWQKPTNLGKPINSSTDDISICFSTDQKGGAFTTSRDGGDDDIFFFYLDGNNRKKGGTNLLKGEDVKTQKGQLKTKDDGGSFGSLIRKENTNTETPK